MLDSVSELIQELQIAIKDTISEQKIGIAFSGGVDSTLLVKLCIDLDYDVILLTIGFQNSHDILFSKRINDIMKLPHKIYEIEANSFNEISKKIKNKINTDNLSWIENSIAFYYVAQLAKLNNLTTVITANGIDELFCGYNAYRDAIKTGEKTVLDLMDSKLENELKMMKAVNSVSSDFKITLLQPFLSERFIKYAKKLPLENKIKNSDDLFRKHIIRKAAIQIDVPVLSANQRKKALQYGSQIHKALIKSK